MQNDLYLISDFYGPPAGQMEMSNGPDGASKLNILINSIVLQPLFSFIELNFLQNNFLFITQIW